MRALGLTPFLLVLLVARPAGAADLCGTLFVPDGYALLCETRIEDGKRRERVVVRPSGRVALAELTLRPLDKAEEPLAWQVPELWLSEQVAVGVSGIASVLRGASETGPLAQPAVRAMVDGLLTMFSGLAQLPHRACIPDTRPGRYQLRCNWDVVLLDVEATLRLVEAGDDRYAISYWAADKRRFRHLEAIANSFKPS
jgi:hypothetical protein